MPARYELMYILPTTLTDEEAGGIETKVSGLLTKLGATIESTKRLGKFKLAYPVKGQRHGYYVLVYFTAETLSIAKMEETLRITPEVVRHLILRVEEGDQKYDLVQFAEIVVEGGRDDRRRRDRGTEKEESKEVKKPEEAKTVEAVAEVKTEAAAVPAKPELSAEELEKKIESALSDDVKGV